jgi:hypothetical protein
MNIHIFSTKSRVFLYTFFVSCFLFLASSSVSAADPKPTIKDGAGYSAKYVSQSIPDPIEMEAGEKRTVTIKFRNTGTQTWNASGSRFISAYTMEPRERSSVFVDSTWKSKKQTNAITKATKPGEVAELTFVLKAPTTPGEYTEEFYLAAENYSWLEGGYFFLKLVVSPVHASTDTGSVEVGTTASSSSTTTPALLAKKSFMTKSKITAAGGKTIPFVLSYKNVGTGAWGDTVLQVSADDPSLFADESWQSQSVIVAQTKVTEPGGFLRQNFVFRTPPKQGTYTLTFRLVTKGVVVGETKLPITVNADAPSSYKTVKLPDDEIGEGEEGSGSVDEEIVPVIDEPWIRVGLFVVKDTVRVRVSDTYRVVVDGIDVATLSSGKSIKLSHDAGTYTARIGLKRYHGTESLQLIPKSDDSAVYTIESYDRMATWKGPKNFNAYRGKLEIRKGQKSDDVWLVNELLLSDYAKGIGENSNGSPMEYLKAQSVAQVSYAYAIMQTDKYGIFDVVATTGDQLYLGYNCELLMPRFVEATEATRGYMVTYNKQVVITPYFAHTNGKTKSWTSVWGGTAKPWLVPVVANYDKGRKLFGHGVGMSQIDAAARAEKEGLNWKELLRYYYTGTKVARIFE